MLGEVSNTFDAPDIRRHRREPGRPAEPCPRGLPGPRVRAEGVKHLRRPSRTLSSWAPRRACPCRRCQTPSTPHTLQRLDPRL